MHILSVSFLFDYISFANMLLLSYCSYDIPLEDIHLYNSVAFKHTYIFFLYLLCKHMIPMPTSYANSEDQFQVQRIKNRKKNKIVDLSCVKLLREQEFYSTLREYIFSKILFLWRNYYVNTKHFLRKQHQ